MFGKPSPSDCGHPQPISVFPFHRLTAEEREKPLLPAVANSHPKGGARPPFDLLNNTTKQTGTQTK